MVWTHGAPLVKYMKVLRKKKKDLVHIWQQKKLLQPKKHMPTFSFYTFSTLKTLET
jgi:hypothetical protein